MTCFYVIIFPGDVLGKSIGKTTAENQCHTHGIVSIICIHVSMVQRLPAYLPIPSDRSMIHHHQHSRILYRARLCKHRDLQACLEGCGCGSLTWQHLPSAVHAHHAYTNLPVHLLLITTICSKHKAVSLPLLRALVTFPNGHRQLTYSLALNENG